MTEQSVYIGLGSNLNSPIVQLTEAFKALANLPETYLVKKSSFYSSDSLLEGQPNYINAIACLKTSLVPDVLLGYLQQIEKAQGRERKQKWGARTLDLDIILFGQQQINTERLTVPHSQMTLRSFVLVPLLEIAPDIRLPNGGTIAALLINCPSQNIRKL